MIFFSFKRAHFSNANATWRCYGQELEAAKAREAALANNVTVAPPAPAVGEGARVEDLVLTSVSGGQAGPHNLFTPKQFLGPHNLFTLQNIFCTAPSLVCLISFFLFFFFFCYFW